MASRPLLSYPLLDTVVYGWLHQQRFTYDYEVVITPQQLVAECAVNYRPYESSLLHYAVICFDSRHGLTRLVSSCFRMLWFHYSNQFCVAWTRALST